MLRKYMSVTENIETLAVYMTVVCMMFLVWCMTKTRLIWSIIMMMIVVTLPLTPMIGVFSIYIVVMCINVLCYGEYDYSSEPGDEDE